MYAVGKPTALRETRASDGPPAPLTLSVNARALISLERGGLSLRLLPHLSSYLLPSTLPFEAFLSDPGHMISKQRE